MFPSSSNLSPTQTKEAAESTGKQDWAQIELADGRHLRTRLVVRTLFLLLCGICAAATCNNGLPEICGIVIYFPTPTHY